LNKIIYFIDDKLGGVSSLNLNLIKNAPNDFHQTVISIKDVSWSLSNAAIQFPVDHQIEFLFDHKSNAYSVLKKMRSLVPEEEGALILNYGSEMAMLDHFPVKQTTFQLVHDEYNLRLAKNYGHVVDAFICHNEFIQSQLLLMYPERKNDIFFLSHGVSIPKITRKQNVDGAPLRLFFLGRFTTSKGIYDLPKIAAILRSKGVLVIWTCIGAGPEEEKFKSSWDLQDNIAFLSPNTNEEVISIASQQDVFVLPTKFEGTPVSLLETMSVGLVPVITSLHGGIHEIVTSDIGYALPIDDNEAFANSIAELHYNRALLEKLSVACRQKVIDQFDLSVTAKAYFSLFSKYRSFKKEKKLKNKKVGSTLDQPFLPNYFTRFIRNIIAQF
jgi:glycosyltransferase involved in cell wall biosynthesis